MAMYNRIEYKDYVSNVYDVETKIRESGLSAVILGNGWCIADSNDINLRNE
jgi:hypothetical protein